MSRRAGGDPDTLSPPRVVSSLSAWGGPVRRARTTATGSERSRRAAKARASSLARSAHWMSSTATTRGRSPARSRRTSATASPTSAGSEFARIASSPAHRCRDGGPPRFAQSLDGRFGGRVVEERGQRRECQVALGDAGAPREDAVGAGAGSGDGMEPQGALADAGLALDEQCTTAAPRRAIARSPSAQPPARRRSSPASRHSPDPVHPPRLRADGTEAGSASVGGRTDALTGCWRRRLSPAPDRCGPATRRLPDRGAAATIRRS